MTGGPPTSVLLHKPTNRGAGFLPTPLPDDAIEQLQQHKINRFEETNCISIVILRPLPSTLANSSPPDLLSIATKGRAFSVEALFHVYMRQVVAQCGAKTLLHVSRANIAAEVNKQSMKAVLPDYLLCSPVDKR